MKCEDDCNITTAYQFFYPIRKKKVKKIDTSAALKEYLENGGEIKKLETPEYKSNHNSHYRQKDIDYEKASRSRFSQKLKDRVEKVTSHKRR